MLKFFILVIAFIVAIVSHTFAFADANNQSGFFCSKSTISGEDAMRYYYLNLETLRREELRSNTIAVKGGPGACASVPTVFFDRADGLYKACAIFYSPEHPACAPNCSNK